MSKVMKWENRKPDKSRKIEEDNQSKATKMKHVMKSYIS